MTVLNGNAFAAANGKPFLANGKKEQTMMSVAIATFVDVVVFLSVSVGFILKVSDLYANLFYFETETNKNTYYNAAINY